MMDIPALPGDLSREELRAVVEDTLDSKVTKKILFFALRKGVFRFLAAGN